MRLIEELLKEQGKLSMMRFMSLLSLLMGCGIAIYGVLAGKDLNGIATLTGVFVVSAFGGKAIQKVVEK